MKKLVFSTQIKATKQRVWNILWSEETYPLWTKVFSETSRAESDWQEGSKILFIDCENNGMLSRIERLIPNEFMSFEHLGVLKNGVEDFSQDWAGAHENYTLTEEGGYTMLHVEVDSDDQFSNFFVDTFPKAMELIKSLSEASKITPFLWFDHQAEEAVNLYTSVFDNSKVSSLVRMGDTVLTAGFSLGGQSFAALNGGPMYRFNPSASFYVVCETEAETDAVWQKLSEGGQVLMPLNTYEWSQKYGWVQDKYGLSWQISMGELADVGQKISPSLLFVGEQLGRAEEAVHFYTRIFKNSNIVGISKYGPNEPQPEGSVKHAQFQLDGQVFMVMDSAVTLHNFQFNEAVSFVINCQTQQEIDYFWDAMTADGGSAGQCGWLKDKFGVSWQVVPPILGQLLGDKDPEKAQRVMQAMLKMKKLDIATLQLAHEQA